MRVVWVRRTFTCAPSPRSVSNSYLIQITYHNALRNYGSVHPKHVTFSSTLASSHVVNSAIIIISGLIERLITLPAPQPPSATPRLFGNYAFYFILNPGG